jgi:hypothetical protein
MRTGRGVGHPLITVIWGLLIVLGSQALAAPTLEHGFRSPPDEAKPWVYWWWLKGNVSESSITRDLEEMKRKCVGGVLLFDARGYHEDHVPPPPSRMEFMSPEWRKKVKFAMGEAHRLGLVMSINLSSCAGALKGPWDVGDDAPKKLIWTAADIQGPRRLNDLPHHPAGRRLWPVALLACRHKESGVAPAVATIASVPNLGGNWHEAVVSARPGAASAEVVDLTEKTDSQGRLIWDVPDGRWTVIRFAFTLMTGRENEVDILSEKAVADHFQRMGRALLHDAGPLTGKTLTHFYSVSWEGACPSWTSGFEQEFRKRRGYDLRPYLPVLAGMTVRSSQITQRFLEDYRRTLGDCFLRNCYGTLVEQCHRAGIKWHSESGGPWDRNSAMFAEADQLSFWAANDMPQGEFWSPAMRQTNCRRTAMAAHIHGLPLAAVEAFTHMQAHWSMYPALLKPGADAALCDGINFFIWHAFTASPPEFGKPGIEYFAGTHLNPNVTWWEQAGDFLTYLARCQFLLRTGRFVADVCCYTSNRNYARWTRGQKWSDKPSLVLPEGFTYDLMNTEVLLNSLSFKGDHLILPDGMRYRLLVVDLEDDATPPEALRKILQLAEAGATVVLGWRRPTRAPGLSSYPEKDAEVLALAGELWGGAGQQPARRGRGKGHMFVGMDMNQVLAAKQIPPDVAGPCDYIHREDTGTDVYFITGRGQFDCTFRTTGKQPELWDPVTGRIQDAACYRATSDGRTIMPINLPENGSVFVVFRKPSRSHHLVSATAPEGGLEIDGHSQASLSGCLWRRGRYVLNNNRSRAITVEVYDLPEPRPLVGPWEVRFASGGGAPERTVFQQLLPWNEHPEKSIRYFSGTATYCKTFRTKQPAARRPVRLDLGKVYNVARVRLNGRDLGVVWTAPWTKDLSGLVRAGTNELEIDVTNLWVNRLIGDAALPASERLIKTNVALFGKKAERPAWQGFSAEDPLLPSGLLGPVRIEFGRRENILLE